MGRGEAELEQVNCVDVLAWPPSVGFDLYYVVKFLLDRINRDGGNREASNSFGDILCSRNSTAEVSPSHSWESKVGGHITS